MGDMGLNINRKKTVYQRFNGDGNSDINLQEQNYDLRWSRVETWVRRYIRSRPALWVIFA